MSEKSHTTSGLAHRHTLIASQLSVKYTSENRGKKVDCFHLICVASVLAPQVTIDIQHISTKTSSLSKLFLLPTSAAYNEVQILHITVLK